MIDPITGLSAAVWYSHVLNNHCRKGTPGVLPLIPAWISNYIHNKVWDEITYPLSSRFIIRKFIQRRDIVQSCCFLISKVECFVLCRQVEQEGEWDPFGNLFIYFERVPYFLADKCLREKSYDQTTSIIIYRPVPIRFPLSNFCYNFAIQIIVSCNGLTPINLLSLIRPMGHPIL